MERPILKHSNYDSNSFFARNSKDLVETALGESYWQIVLQHPGVFFSSFEQTAGAGKRIEGHSAGAGGGKLAAYIALGISSCHEGINAEQILERLRNGLYTMIREGSIRSDLSEIARIKDKNIDFRRLLISSSIEKLDHQITFDHQIFGYRWGLLIGPAIKT